jgi:hypothetical protein
MWQLSINAKGKMAARSEEDYKWQTILPGIDVPAKYFALRSYN